jgi:apolipoprotein N-acyltransferase
MQQAGTIDYRIPPAREPTPYSRWGDWTLLALVVFLSVALLAGKLPNNRRPS